MAKGRRRRAGRAEHERRLAEVMELLASRASTRAIVRYASETWGIGERAAEKYVAEARGRLCASAAGERRAQLGLAHAGYEFIFRRQLKAGDLKNARATLDKLVALLGLAVPARERPLTLDGIEAEIARLEAAIAAREEQTP